MVHSDNKGIFGMINKGITVNPFFMTCLRNLFWLSVTYNLRIIAVHILGMDNIPTDGVSCLHEPSCPLEFFNL